MERGRQVFQSLKSHVQGSLPVILIEPVAELAAAKAEGIKVMLPDDLLAFSVIRTGSGDVFKLRRYKALFPALAPAFGVLLRPAQGCLSGGKVALQNGIALCDIVGSFLPVIITGIALAVVKVKGVAARHLLFFCNAELLLFRLPCIIPFKLCW